MKTLVATALLAYAQADETSLMQDLLKRGTSRTQLSTTADSGSKTAKLLDTAVNMLKSGVTPDVQGFIQATEAEIEDVNAFIISGHVEDQRQITLACERLQAAVDRLAQRTEEIEISDANRVAASHAHRLCRSEEAILCGQSRKCEETLRDLWVIVRNEESIMRGIHHEIYEEWCVEPTLDNQFHAGCGVDADGTQGVLNHCFNWAAIQDDVGVPYTSSYVRPNEPGYPILDIQPSIRTLRGWSVTKFHEYIAQKTVVETAWRRYNEQLPFCSEFESDLYDKINAPQSAPRPGCDSLQETMHTHSCVHASTNREARLEFGREWHLAITDYELKRIQIEQDEEDRKREWETLTVVSCLLRRVYTSVQTSIDTGAPCPNIESDPEGVAQSIEECHIVTTHEDGTDDILDGVVGNRRYEFDGSDVDSSTHRGCGENDLTGHLCIEYCDDPCFENPACIPPPREEPACTPTYIAKEQGSFFDAQTDYAVGLANAQLVLPDSRDLSLHIGLSDFLTQESLAALSIHGWAGCAAPLVCKDCAGLHTIEVDTDRSEPSVSCLKHEEDLFPGESDMDTFRCLDSYCLSMSGRCNGVSQCNDGSDEVGCDTPYEGPAYLGTQFACPADFLTDVFHQCASGHCIQKVGLCNRQPNCADGSDETGCTGDLVIDTEATSGRTVSMETIQVGGSVFYGRDYTFDSSLGDFAHKKMIKYSNNDKETDHEHVMMKLRTEEPVTVYIVQTLHTLASGGDGASGLEWLESEGFTLSAHQGVAFSGLQSSHDSEVLTRHMHHREWNEDMHHREWIVPSPSNIYAPANQFSASVVHSKTFEAGTISIPGNGGGDGSFLIFVDRPETPSATAPDGYLGCYRDTGARDLGTMQGGQSGPYNTYPLCHAHCASLGKAFMSLQYGGECFCADSYGAQSGSTVFPQIADSECSMTTAACHTGNSRSCGGTWAQAIYSVASVPANYAMVHDGHCASGWISGSNTLQLTISACSEGCRSNANCGYFAFAQESGSSTNCALYTAAGGCADDNNFPAYNAYQMQA